MTKFTERQTAELADSILGALNSWQLEQMIRVHFGDGIYNHYVAEKMPLAEAAFKLVDGLNREGRADALLEAIAAMRPNREDVQAVCQRLRAELEKTPLVSPAPPAPSDSPPSPSGNPDFASDRRRAERRELLRRLDQTLANEDTVRHPGCFIVLVILVFVMGSWFPDLWNGFFNWMLSPVRGRLQTDSLQHLGILVRLLTTALLAAGLWWLLLRLMNRFRSRALAAMVRAFPDDIHRWGGLDNLAHRPTLRKIIAAEEPTLLENRGPQASTSPPADPVRLQKQLHQRKLISALEAHRSLLAERQRPAVLSYAGQLALAGIVGFFGGSLSAFPLLILLVGVGSEPKPSNAWVFFLPHFLITAALVVVFLRRVQARRRDAFTDPMPTYRSLAQEYPEKASIWGEACLQDLASVDAILTAEKVALTVISTSS
jgi:hypothetical protein